MTAEITPLLEMDLPAQNLELALLALQAFSQATGKLQASRQSLRDLDSDQLLASQKGDSRG